MFLQADDRKVTRTAASIAVAAEHCLNLHAGEFAQQQADRRRSGGKEPSAVGTALWRLDASGFHKERQSANDHLTQTWT